MVFYKAFIVYYLEAVVRPRAEFHHARLFVKREEFHVYFTGRLVNGRGFPFDAAAVVKHSFSGQRHFEIPVGT